MMKLNISVIRCLVGRYCLHICSRFYFLNGQWMAVEEGDGQVERILPVAGLGDLAAFKHLFATSVRM